MAALADYLDLKVEALKMVGDKKVVAVFGLLTQMAETKLNRKLRHRSMRTETTLSFTSGEATLPSDYIEVLNLYNQHDEPMAQTGMSATKLSGWQYDRYAVDGTKAYIYGVTGDRTMEYYAKLSTLTASDTTSNWLLAGYPDVYLYALAYECAVYCKDVDLAGLLKGQLREALRGVRTDTARAEWGNAKVRLEGCTP